MPTLCLSGEDVRRYADMADMIPAVEEAFAAYARGTVQMPAKSYIDLPQYNGDFRSMPAYLRTDEWESAVVKWVNVHPDNPEAFDLPTVMGTVIYSDPETAFPLSVMDGTELTMKRTGAAAAVATDHLAVDDATSLGIVGAGVQSYAQLEAISAVRPIDTVVVSDPDEEAVRRFVDRFSDRFDVRSGSITEAGHCDVVSTVTPVDSPIVAASDVGDHTHINAIGADAAGKQELDPAILQDGKLVIDDREQTTHSGEINSPWGEGTIDDGDIHAELGDVVTGNATGRTAADGVSVFDSTGLAIQDAAAAHVVFENARQADAGQEIDLVDVA